MYTPRIIQEFIVLNLICKTGGNFITGKEGERR